MANPEIVAGSNATQASIEKPQLSLHARVISALEDRFAKDPFYTGRNAVMFGLATPIRKNRDGLNSPDEKNSTGSTPEDFYFENLAEPQESNSTPESVQRELSHEREQRNDRIETKTADELFGRTLMLQQDAKTGVVVRRGSRRGIDWGQQANWKRDWEITGDFLGGELSLEGVGKKHGVTRQRVEQILKRHLEDVLVHLGESDLKPKAKSGDKPFVLMHLRQGLEDPESFISQFLSDIESGMDIIGLLEKYGMKKVSRNRQLLASLLGENIVEHKIKMFDPEYVSEFALLDDPDLERERKQELLDRITHSRIYNVKNQDLSETYKKLHVQVLSKALKEAGVYVDFKSMPQIIAIINRLDPEIIIKSVPLVSRDETLGVYRLIANGDMGRLAQVTKANELQYYTTPALKTYGKQSTDGPKNTTDIQKGARNGRYKSTTVSRELRALIEEGVIDFGDIVPGDCPWSVYVKRSGNIFLEADDATNVRMYLRGREKKVLGEYKARE